MDRLRVGMVVRDVRGKTVGRIGALQSCCFEIEGARFQMNLTPGSIFNVEAGEATLICYDADCARYACPLHQAAPAAASSSGVARESG